MNRSTAGVVLESGCGWFMTVAGAEPPYRSPVIATAAQIARAAGKSLRCELGVAELGRRAQQERHDVGRHIVRLTADGFIEPGARGRGWGRPTVLGLVLPALYQRSEIGGSSLRSPDEIGGSSLRSPDEIGGSSLRSPDEIGGSSLRSPDASPCSSVLSTESGVEVGEASSARHRIQEAQVRRRGLAALADEAVREVYYGLAGIGLKAYDSKQRQLLAGAIASRLDEDRTPEALVDQVALQFDSGRGGGIRQPWAFFLDRTEDLGPRIAPRPKPGGTCPTHMLEEPCRSCAADLKVGAR